MLYEAKHISRTYLRGESQVRALDDICLDIDEGEYVAIVGPSGSGKTTLLNVLGLLDGDIEGDLLFRKESVTRATEKDRARLRLQHVGIVHQGFHLLSALNVRENVALPQWRLTGERNASLSKAEAILSNLGLDHRLYHRVNLLSAGEMQRVAIARALINEPSVVLADEPTGNLDSASIQEVLNSFSQIAQQGRTLIVVTHEPLMEAAARRVIKLRHGNLQVADRIAGRET